MRAKLFISLSFILFISGLYAQQSPSEIKYKIWDIHALRHYPFKASADSIVKKAIDKYTIGTQKEELISEDISLDFIINKRFHDQNKSLVEASNNILYRYLFKPYGSWMNQARPLDPGNKDVALSVFHSSRHHGQGKVVSEYDGVFDFPGQYTVNQLLIDAVGDMDIFKRKNDLLLNYISGPLSPSAMKNYKYYLTGEEEIDGKGCHEVVFLSLKKKDMASEGFLYIDKNDYSVVKAVVTINYYLPIGFGRNILMTHHFEDNIIRAKETQILIGDDVEGGFLINKSQVFDEKWAAQSFSNAAEQAQKLNRTAKETRAWRNVQKVAALGLTEHVMFRTQPKFEFGPVLRIVSYNRMEGLRFRIGGRTTTYLNKHVGIGGYVAYGVDDEKFKYRGDITYSLTPKNDSYYEFPRSLITLSYVSDLNIPGQDLLNSTRDNVFYSFSHSRIDNMSRQKIAQFAFQHELENRLSFEFKAKHMRDLPKGIVEHDMIRTFEVGLNIRYAPNEKKIQVRDKTYQIRPADIDVNIGHRIGLRGIFDAGYNYHISSFSLGKQVHLPQYIGKVDIEVSGGKIWNSVPFPLLFIPKGNQSYIYDDDEHNLMQFYEFITDNYIAGKLHINFNWSPIDWVFPKLGIHTHIGGKAIYGPLSDMNNPALHPNLFPFNNGVTPLGNDPYIEMNVGFSNILKLFRIDYARRFTYLSNEDAKRGSILVGLGLSF